MIVHSIHRFLVAILLSMIKPHVQYYYDICTMFFLEEGLLLTLSEHRRNEVNDKRSSDMYAHAISTD